MKPDRFPARARRRHPAALIVLILASLVAPAATCAAGAAPRPTAVDAAAPDVLALPGGAVRIEIEGFDDPRRVRELRAWADECVRATLTAYGRLPLPRVRLRIEPSTRTGARSPVPWGQTARGRDVAVLLYVRPDAQREELRADWTAVHELSHLFHPFLGDEGRWLAEGLASYYQNVLRARAGLMTPDEAWRRLDAGFGRGRREDSGRPLRELSRAHAGTMRVYWAGAAYWLRADLALRQRGSSLDAVLAKHGACCLRGTGRVAADEFLAELDRLAGSDVFLPLYARQAEATTFPALDPAYAALGLQADTAGLRFSPAAPARALREAIMGRRAPP